MCKLCDHSFQFFIEGVRPDSGACSGVSVRVSVSQFYLNVCRRETRGGGPAVLHFARRKTVLRFTNVKRRAKLSVER